MENITKKLFIYDKSYGVSVAGTDEAGRGSLAGPLVCAACMMPLNDLSCMIDGADDSKKISEINREQLFERIIAAAISYKISVIDTEVIDEINILQATKKGMSDAINGLKIKPDLILIDAVSGLNTDIQCQSLIKGDATSYSIACASILAKVARDRIMRKLDQKYPQYGFFKNKGYGTREHVEALKSYGATPLHRKLFIRNALASQLEFTI